MMGNTVQKGLWLDPRAKLFLILMCVLSSMFAPSLTYQFALVLLIAVLGVLCGKWKYAIKGVCFYAVSLCTDSLDHGGHDGDAADHVCCVPWAISQGLRLRDAGRDSLVYNERSANFYPP